MELNKLVAGVCATLLAYLGLNFFAELIYEPYHGDDHHLAFALEIEESDDDGGEEEIDFAALFAAADLAEGEKVFKKCKSCHALEAGKHNLGPSLHGVVGRAINGAEGFEKYSGNLPGDETWTAQNLFNFLGDPGGWSREKTGSKTSMGFAGIKKAEDRAAIIAYLNETDGTPEPLE